MEKRTGTDDFRVSQTACTLLSLIRGPIAKHAVEAAAAMEAGMMRRDRLLDFAGRPRALRNTRVPIPAPSPSPYTLWITWLPSMAQIESISSCANVMMNICTYHNVKQKIRRSAQSTSDGMPAHSSGARICQTCVATAVYPSPDCSRHVLQVKQRTPQRF
jgi:hypothetical protein